VTIALLLFLLVAGVARPAPTIVEPTPEQRHVIADYAWCLARKHRVEAVELVLNQGVPRVAARVPSRRAVEDCVPAQAARRDLDPLDGPRKDAFLFGLADVLAREEFPAFDPNVIGTAQPLPTSHLVDALWPLDSCKKCNPEQLKRLEEVRARASAVLAPQMFGECVVRTDPENAHRLIMTEPASQDERSTLQSLGSAFGECVMQGSQFRADRALLRGVVALSYYRIAHAPRVELSGAQK
jgi:hypothetical protein